jgi:hypothetical protein
VRLGERDEVYQEELEDHVEVRRGESAGRLLGSGHGYRRMGNGHACEHIEHITHILSVWGDIARHWVYISMDLD